jgi:hypothetical protein
MATSKRTKKDILKGNILFEFDSRFSHILKPQGTCTGRGNDVLTRDLLSNTFDLAYRQGVRDGKKASLTNNE